MLDSIADSLFVGVVAMKIVPLLLTVGLEEVIVVCIGIVSVRILAYSIGWLKFHCFVSLHTICNKITGLILFLIPYCMNIVDISFICTIACVVASFSALEEVLCEIYLKEYQPNIKTIVELWKNK